MRPRVLERRPIQAMSQETERKNRVKIVNNASKKPERIIYSHNKKVNLIDNPAAESATRRGRWIDSHLT